MFVYQMWPQMKLNYRNIIIIIIIIICSYFKQVLLTTAVKVVDSVHWYVINIYEIWAVLNVFFYICIKHKHKSWLYFCCHKHFTCFSKQVKCVWAVKSSSVGFSCLEEILVTWWPPIGWCLYIGVATQLWSVLPKNLVESGVVETRRCLSFFYDLIIGVVAFYDFPSLVWHMKG